MEADGRVFVAGDLEAMVDYNRIQHGRWGQ